MKVEKISPDKFRIIFSDEDLREFGVDFENIKYNFDETQEIFWDLIEHAQIDEDFFGEGDQIVVEAIASKNNGLTMTITRICRENEKFTQTRDNCPIVFRFTDFEDLIKACKYMGNTFEGVSCLYKLCGEYYLVMNAIHKSFAVNVESVLYEYGEKVIDSLLVSGRLAEYGDLLLKNTAISSISVNF